VCWPLALAAVLPLAIVTVASAEAQTPTRVETARRLLGQYQDDPTRIDRARSAGTGGGQGGSSDVPTLLTLARALFLFGEERALTDEAKVGASVHSRE
jgi:hypothetical protein